MRLLKLLAPALVLLAALSTGNAPRAQVKQSGNVTPGHVAMWTTTGVIQDGGSATAGFLSSIGVVASGPAQVTVGAGRMYQAGQVFFREDDGGVVIGSEHVDVPRFIEPMAPPALAELGRGEEPVDEPLPSALRFVADELFKLLLRRRQARQVEVRAAAERALIGPRRR